MCLYVPVHTPGGLLRKPPLKCVRRAAPVFCAQIYYARYVRALTFGLLGLRTWSYGPHVSAYVCATQAPTYVRSKGPFFIVA